MVPRTGRGVERIVDVAAAGCFLPRYYTPHAPVTLGDADVGHFVRYFPIACRIGCKGRSQAGYKNDSAMEYRTREFSWAVQHGLNLCLSRMIQTGGKTPH